MSFEHFKDLGVDANVAAVRRTQENKIISPVEALAERMIEAGKSALKIYVNSQMDRSSGLVYKKSRIFRFGLRSKHSEDLAAIELGTSIVGLHRALADKNFSIQKHIDYWNETVTGLPFMHAYPPLEDIVEEFTQGQWNEMVALSQKDPTLISFFQIENVYLLPHGLLNFVRGKHLLEKMHKVAPTFSEIAGVVAPSMYLPDQEVKRRQKTLEEFDGTIAMVHEATDAIKSSLFANVLERNAAALAKKEPNEFADEVILHINPNSVDVSKQIV